MMLEKITRTCCDTLPGRMHTAACFNSFMNTGEIRVHVNSAPEIMKSPVSEIAEDAIGRAAIRDMNLLPATRIGWEHKQQYTDRLAQLSAEGYLDPGEYEARMTWLQNAKTDEEAKVAFKDLPSLRVAKVELARTHPRQWERRNTQQEMFWFAVSLGVLITSLLTGGLMTGLIISLPLTLLWGGFLIRDIRAHD